MFRVISGAGVYGADANDEALIFGTADLPFISGHVKMDVHRIFIYDLSVDTPFMFRLIYGSGTMAEAITAKQFSTVPVINTVTGNRAGGGPIDIMMPRITCSTDQVWIQCKCATNNATADFLVGGHEYRG